jgi:hypothetical protein
LTAEQQSLGSLSSDEPKTWATRNSVAVVWDYIHSLPQFFFLWIYEWQFNETLYANF